MTDSDAAPGVRKLISGGQTGVDRGALDAAIELGLDHGGWCPRGRRAENGAIPPHYRLTEHTSSEYAARTERNVLDSDATLIISRGPISGGTELTRRLAEKHRKPCLVVDLASLPPAAELRAWLARHAVRVLNVAGPRESQSRGISAEAKEFLLRLLS